MTGRRCTVRRGATSDEHQGADTAKPDSQPTTLTPEPLSGQAAEGGGLLGDALALDTW